jgi:hypothetical protein
MTSPIAFSMTWLPAVLPVISSAWRIGTPAVTSADSVRLQRASAIFCTIVPIFIGALRRRTSHCLRPTVVLFHLRKARTMPTIPGIQTNQQPLTNPDRATVTFVIAAARRRGPRTSSRTPGR